MSFYLPGQGHFQPVFLQISVLPLPFLSSWVLCSANIGQLDADLLHSFSLLLLSLDKSTALSSSSLALSSLVLLLNPSIVFFSAVSVFFNSVTSVWCLLVFSVSLLKLPLCSCVLLSSVSAFVISILNYVSGESQSISLRSFSEVLSFWGEGIYSSLSSFSLPLYVGFYALDKTDTSPSLGDEPHPSSRS